MSKAVKKSLCIHNGSGEQSGIRHRKMYMPMVCAKTLERPLRSPALRGGTCAVPFFLPVRGTGRTRERNTSNGSGPERAGTEV